MLERRSGWEWSGLRRAVVFALCGVTLAGSAAKATAQQPGNPPAASAAGAQDRPVLTPQELAHQQQLLEQEEKLLKDWPNLKRYQAENAALPPATAGDKRVVFMGDSITQGWMNHGTGASEATPGFFPGKPYIDRGISGQTTPQMLLRFQQDVIHLKPSVVVIFAGTNDVAGNTGDMTAEQTEDNITSMAELAHANGIQVVLCSILPAYDFPWKPGRTPAPKIVALNTWIKNYAEERGYVYVDFHAAMVDERGGLPAKLSHDGVHPLPAGYEIMNPLVEAGIAKALAGK